MSWFRRALTITTVHEDSFYTSVDPGEFYEWKFMGFIPKGKIFTKRLPPSDIFTNGMIIATARLPRKDLDKKDFGFETNKNIDSDIYLQAGQIQSPSEIINKYNRINSNFHQSINRFRSASHVRSYFVSGKKRHLFRISNNNTDDKVFLYDYGPITNILKRLDVVRNSFSKDSLTKKGRAHEMENFRRFENAITFVKNNEIPIDSTKIDLLLSLAEIKPEHNSSMGWKECFITVSNEASLTKNLLDRYNSLQWVRLINSSPSLL